MLSATALCVSGMALAQQPSPAAAPAATQSLSKTLGVVVFPAKGQTAEQQSQDEGACYAWARTDSGVDPIAPATAQQQLLQTFNKGFYACMQSKGYTVN